MNQRTHRSRRATVSQKALCLLELHQPFQSTARHRAGAELESLCAIFLSPKSERYCPAEERVILWQASCLLSVQRRGPRAAFAPQYMFPYSPA